MKKLRKILIVIAASVSLLIAFRAVLPMLNKRLHPPEVDLNTLQLCEPDYERYERNCIYVGDAVYMEASEEAFDVFNLDPFFKNDKLPFGYLPARDDLKDCMGSYLYWVDEPGGEWICQKTFWKSFPYGRSVHGNFYQKSIESRKIQ